MAVMLSEKRRVHGAEWQRLFLCGVGIKAIAGQYGVSRETVSKEIAASGVTRTSKSSRSLPMEAHIERFWSRVQRDPGPCWIWKGRINRQGYGKTYSPIDKRQRLAHRMAYTFAVGPIPAGLTIDHLCRTPLCVRPDHLRACTITENLMAAHSQATPAVNARKTHCLRGHAYLPANLFVDKQGYRHCVQCRAVVRREKAARSVA